MEVCPDKVSPNEAGGCEFRQYIRVLLPPLIPPTYILSQKLVLVQIHHAASYACPRALNSTSRSPALADICEISLNISVPLTGSLATTVTWATGSSSRESSPGAALKTILNLARPFFLM